MSARGSSSQGPGNVLECRADSKFIFPRQGRDLEVTPTTTAAPELALGAGENAFSLRREDLAAEYLGADRHRPAGAPGDRRFANKFRELRESNESSL